MPLGLISTIWPFAVSLPAISEGSPACTRFKVIELDDGCWKLVRSLGAILKLIQLIAARSVDWVMSSWFELGAVIVADPATTWPPFGLASASPPAASVTRAVSADRRSTGRRSEVFILFSRPWPPPSQYRTTTRANPA